MSSSLAIQPAAVDRRSIPLPGLPRIASRRRADEVQFWVVYLLTFPVFLLSSSVRRVLPGLRPARSGRSAEAFSVIREAKASARTCGSFSLMG